MPTDSVHAGGYDKVLARFVLGGQKKAASLSSREIDEFCFRRLSVHTINLHDAHLVAFKPNILSGERSNVDHADEICSIGFDRNFEVLCLIHQRCVRYWLSSSGVGFAHKGLDQTRHLIMVPVRECQNKLFTILILVGIFWIVDDQGSTESVWILAFIVGMIPVGARLVKLDDLTLEDGLRN